jgi:putative ABC transport system permease protein
MLRQVAVVVIANLKGIPSRWQSSLVLVLATAGVVAVLVGLLSLLEGLERVISGSAREDRAIILASGARSESTSSLSRDSVAVLRNGPGIARAADQPLFVPEAVMIVTLPLEPGGELGELTLRGTAPLVSQVRPEFRLVEGRMFEPGTKQLIVGQSARKVLDQDSRVGGDIEINNSRWTVVGTFSTGGDIHESELWSDAEVVLSDFRRNSFQSATALLESPQAMTTLASFVESSPATNAAARSETQYVRGQAQVVNAFLGGIARIAGTIMALGALLAAVNTMMSALVARYREIGVLSAIGFGSTPIALSMIVEALFLSLLGAGLGVLLATVLFDGAMTSTVIQGSSSRIVFQMVVVRDQLVVSAAIACAVAVVGCLLPAIRAHRIPLPTLITAR